MIRQRRYFDRRDNRPPLKPISIGTERRITYQCFDTYFPEWEKDRKLYVKMLKLSRLIPIHERERNYNMRRAA